MRSKAKSVAIFCQVNGNVAKIAGGGPRNSPETHYFETETLFYFHSNQETFAKFAMSGAGSNGQPPLQKVAARAIALLLGQKQNRLTPSCHTIPYLCHFQQHPGRRPRLLLFYPRASPHEPPAPTLLFLTGSISMPAARPSIQPA